MVFASIEQINKLTVLENEYFNLRETHASETSRCILRGELVEGFVKSEEMVDEAIEKLTKRIEVEKSKKENNQTVNSKKTSDGVVVAQFEGYDADTGERIHKGDFIVKTHLGWSKIENAF